MLLGWIWLVVVGLISGWAAGKIMKGSGYGVVVDILLGMAGGIVGGVLLGFLDIHGEGIIEFSGHGISPCF
jgi:uncharacterized membrane protein YeaQ/YmgE (transglycosylase-associated protein family)